LSAGRGVQDVRALVVTARGAADAREVLMLKRFMLAVVLLVLVVLVWNFVTNFQPRH